MPLAISIFLSIPIRVCCGQESELKRFPFNKEDALKEWKEKVFRGRVFYEVNPAMPQGYLLAKSDKASSGLFYKIKFNPRKYPYISWNWKVGKFPSKDKHAKNDDKRSWIERDDYAVRVYVIFPAFIFTNTRCIEYIWSEDLPKGAVLTSPFYGNIKLIVLESGSAKLGEWVLEERNIMEDYRLAFGSFSSAAVGAIALMTDADNTMSASEGYYADIKVGYSRPISQGVKTETLGEFEQKPSNHIVEFWEHIKQIFSRSSEK